MRIIAGKYKKVKLVYDKTPLLRPTQDRIRESMFNIINEWISDAVVCDLFCGTGSIGLEALSRGAKKVTFVDKNTRIIKKNITLLEDKFHDSLSNKAHVFGGSCHYFLTHTQETFDVIILDPPWHNEKDYIQTLQLIEKRALIKERGVVLCEHRKDMTIPYDLSQWDPKRYQYKETILTILINTNIKEPS